MPLRLLSPIHKASRQIALYLGQELDAEGAPARDAHLLSYLAHYGPAPVGEIARVFGLKGSTLTSKLDRLERSDLVSREVDPDDRRSFLVRLEPEGRRQARRVDRVVRRFEQRVLASSNARDLAGFDAVLAAIAETTRVVVRPDNSINERPKDER